MVFERMRRVRKLTLVDVGGVGLLPGLGALLLLARGSGRLLASLLLLGRRLASRGLAAGGGGLLGLGRHFGGLSRWSGLVERRGGVRLRCVRWTGVGG
jgi:hypothetical protein